MKLRELIGTLRLSPFWPSMTRDEKREAVYGFYNPTFI